MDMVRHYNKSKKIITLLIKVFYVRRNDISLKWAEFLLVSVKTAGNKIYCAGHPPMREPLLINKQFFSFLAFSH